MIRNILVTAIALTIPAAPVLADPPNLCQLEEQGAQSPPCPSYITYGEEGEEISGAAAADASHAAK